MTNSNQNQNRWTRRTYAFAIIGAMIGSLFGASGGLVLAQVIW